MNTSVSSQITLIHVEPCLVASKTCRGMITAASSWVVSRSLLSMATPLKISTGIEAGPVTSRLCFIVGSWVFPFSRSCSQIVSMICCLFSVTVRTKLWAGSGVEGVSLCRLLACTVRDVPVELFKLYSQ